MVGAVWRIGSMAEWDLAHSSQGVGIKSIVDSIPGAAVATHRDNKVIALNSRFADILQRPTDQILGANFLHLIEARDIFGNLLGEDSEGLHQMVERFERVKDFKLDIVNGKGQHLFVGISVIIVLVPGSDDYNLIYLMTEIKRRRRSDQFLDQILVGVGTGNTKSYVGEEARGMAEAYPLTSRQKEVLRLLAEGKNPIEISDVLCLSIHTVRSHIQKILRILEVNSQLEAVTKALTLRIL